MTIKMIPAKMPLVHKKKYYITDDSFYLIQYYVGEHPVQNGRQIFTDNTGNLKNYPNSTEFFEKEVTVTRWAIVHDDKSGLHLCSTIFSSKENAEAALRIMSSDYYIGKTVIQIEVPTEEDSLYCGDITK